MTQNPKLYCINKTQRELKDIQTVKGRIEYIINFSFAINYSKKNLTKRI